jgi:hypothetical protein
VDIEVLDRALDDAVDDVVEAEALHEATDGAGVQVEDAGRVTLCTNDAADGAGSEAENVAGLALDDLVEDVSNIEAVSDAAGSARLEAEDAGRVTLGANNATDSAGSEAEDITRLALDDLVKDVSNVQALSGTANSAGTKVEGLVRVAGLANNTANGAGSKAEDIARLALDNVVNNAAKVEALGDAANSAGAKVEGLIGVARVANNGANGTRAEVKGVTGVTLDDVVDGVAKVEAVGEATNEARAKVKSLVGVARVANNGADGTRAKVQGVTRVALDDVVDGVAKVEAIGEATDEARVEAESLVSVAAVAAKDGADGTGAKVEGVVGVALDDLVNNVVGVQAVGEATDKARVEAESLVSVAAVAAKYGADGTGAKVQGITGVTLEAETNVVDSVGDAVEERGDSASDDVTLDDGKGAESLVEVEAREKVVDEGIALDDGEVANGLAKVKAADNTVEEVTLGGDINVDVVDDVLDLVENAGVATNDGALGDVEATDSVEDAVESLANTAANNAVDEVASLDTDLDAVDSVLDVADSSRDSSRKGVVDDAALDRKVKTRDDRKAAGDGIDVGDTGKNVTLGGHGKGGRRKGESDESVLHLEKECVY